MSFLILYVHYLYNTKEASIVESYAFNEINSYLTTTTILKFKKILRIVY